MQQKLNLLIQPKIALLACGIVSTLLLAGAHAFERIGQMPPCALCLDQRDVHWVALTVFVIGGGLWIALRTEKILASMLGVLSAVFGYSTWLAGYHAGVEWKFWPGPPTCSGSGGEITVTDPADLINQLGSEPIVSCTDAAWRMFGVSMAGYNAIISFSLAVIAGVAAVNLARSAGLLPLAGSTTNA